MKTMVGLWIDHRKSVIVVVSDRGEETKVIESHVERQPGRFAGVRSTPPYESQRVPADDSRERAFTGHLHGYYDEVVEAVRGGGSILIFGPGEAKGELKKRLERDNLGGHIVAASAPDRPGRRQHTLAATARGQLERGDHRVRRSPGCLATVECAP